MTVTQLLATMDSRELSEHMVCENLDWWRTRIADNEKARSKQLMHALFGKAIARGKVKWREKMKSTSL